MSRGWIVEDSGPYALERIQSPLVDPLLDRANVRIRKGPGTHRYLKFGSIEAVLASDGRCQARQCRLWGISFGLIDRPVECLDNKIFVRGEQ